MIITDEIKVKALVALDKWAVAFKIIGNGGDETPRYSQLMQKEGAYALRSTQKDLWYELNLTPEEQLWLQYQDSNHLWAAWKEMRTEHLLKFHPTIKPY